MSGNDPELATGGHYVDNSGQIHRDETKDAGTSHLAFDGKLYNDEDLDFDPQVGYVPHQGAIATTPISEVKTQIANNGQEYDKKDLHYNFETGEYEPIEGSQTVNQKHLQELRDFRDQTNLHDGQVIPETEPSRVPHLDRSDIIDVPIKHDVPITEALRSQDAIQEIIRENEALREENQRLKKLLNPYSSEDELKAALDPDRKREPDYLEQVQQIHDPKVLSYAQELEQGRSLTPEEMGTLRNKHVSILISRGKDPVEAFDIASKALDKEKDKDGNINSKRLTKEGREILLGSYKPEQTHKTEPEDDEKKEKTRVDPIETKRAKLTVKALLLKGAEWTGTQIARASLALVELLGKNRTNHIQDKLDKETDPAKRAVLENALNDWKDVYRQADEIRIVLGLPTKNRSKA